MATVTIATSSDPFFSQSTTLDGTPYGLRFTYNQREDCYYLAIEDGSTGLDLVSGIKVVSNYPLATQFKYVAGMPQGILMAISNVPSDDSPARLGELGPNGRVTLLYTS